ncbi:hypothetical protein BCR32DRAFT_294569 [Anaeromyces robustus]|uniref:Uncharacterized protein n=1 Tax=Anaeromyces robustus TaxID=1754192 RepID=A0A1Y1X0E4_9FUNG|nr:hypothetical protein BCR32DRAFT_294569 [Anaeromyces robustus]|eukprot:ORX79213.1 hypothetical protein BCR32DRAFT_294569 [Anaeromyces robustus]
MISPLCSSQRSEEHRSVQYFPLSANVLDRHDHALWQKIAELGKNKSIETYYDDLVSAAESVTPLDWRFAVLVEVGNLAAIKGRYRSFQKAVDCLSQITKSLNPNDALVGLKN